MQRLHQLVFALSTLALCWLGMMAIHELGHVIGAVCTGGSVTGVVLHPLRISRTDVFPNPLPGAVVWCGPIIGSLLPLAVALQVPRQRLAAGKIAHFFAGFCLIANGAYISLGSFDGVGDCGEMLRTGTPAGVLLMFGIVTIPAGLYLWHGLGSFSNFARDPSIVKPRLTYVSCGLLAAVLILEFSLSLP